MRRIILLVTVSVVMAAVMVASALPVLAKDDKLYRCFSGLETQPPPPVTKEVAKQAEKDGLTCTKIPEGIK